MLARADPRDVATGLKPALATDALLCTDASNALSAAVWALGIEHHAVNASRGAWQIQIVNAHHNRFRPWKLRFHGLATPYLSNCLGWFRALDRNAQTGTQPAARLALAIGA